MNQILFGVIGLFMFAITGIGFAEVRLQMKESEAVAVKSEGVVAGESVTRSQVEGSVTKDAKPSTPASTATVQAKTSAGAVAAPTNVVQALSAAAQKVERAYFGDDDSDEYEYEDEDEDDDDEDRENHRSKSSSQTSAATAPGTAQTGTASASPSTNTSAPTPSVATYSMSEVATHNSAASCYTTIEGSVYDVTSYVSKHPGGQSAIKSICGVDGSAAFGGQHSGAGKPTSTLAQFKIGVLQ